MVKSPFPNHVVKIPGPLAGDLCQLEKQRSMAQAEAEATSQGICEVEMAIKDSRLYSIQVPGCHWLSRHCLVNLMDTSI